MKNPLHTKTIFPLTPLFWRVKALYEASFPAVERISLVWMVGMSLLKKADFQAYFDGDTFCGFAFSLYSDKVYYLFFLAVAKDLQSKGYGKKILADAAMKAAGRPVFAVIEPIDREAENYGQRLRRLAFYEKHGYSLTDYLYYEDQEVYQVLTTQADADVSHFEQVAKKVEQLGLQIRLIKVKK